MNSTTISGDYVHMRYADQTDPARAVQWIDFRLPVADLADLDDKTKPLDLAQNQYLGGVQLAALRRVQTLIDAETKGLSARFAESFLSS